MKILLACLLSLLAPKAFAAVGCDLNEPDRDVSRLFPPSTGFQTVYLSVQTAGGAAMLSRIEGRLGDRFTGLFETIDVPYTLYRINQGNELLGYIHGVNQKGEYGGIQVFLALNLDGKISAFYIQKLTSRAAKALRSQDFAAQFKGLSLRDFMAYDPVSGQSPQASAVFKIRNPAPSAARDFKAILRAVKKNLILMDELVYSQGKK